MGANMMGSKESLVARKGGASSDRRDDDIGPPVSWRDRRLLVERRLPTLKEDEISEAEWFKRMACFKAKRRIQREAIRSAYELMETS